jgi:hypothetical protein
MELVSRPSMGNWLHTTKAYFTELSIRISPSSYFQMTPVDYAEKVAYPCPVYRWPLDTCFGHPTSHRPSGVYAGAYFDIFSVCLSSIVEII